MLVEPSIAAEAQFPLLAFRKMSALNTELRNTVRRSAGRSHLPALCMMDIPQWTVKWTRIHPSVLSRSKGNCREVEMDIWTQGNDLDMQTTGPQEMIMPRLITVGMRE